jgi:hypothetical protein
MGDANIPSLHPQFGCIANSTAKQAAAGTAAALRDDPLPAAVYYNACYSHVGAEYGISVATSTARMRKAPRSSR